MSLVSYSAAWPSTLDRESRGHLLRSDLQEDLCFGLWYPSRGSSRTTALLHKVLLPRAGERLVHGNASFLPSYFERAIGEAIDAGAGLAFMHSHGGPGWQGMSDDDVAAELNHAPAAFAATGLPLVGLTLGTDGAWSARFWERVGSRKYECRWCTSVRVVGDRLATTFHPRLAPVPQFGDELSRTVSAWGEGVQRDLGRLHVGVVGAGSVGSIVAESLARIGVGRITLLDFDSLELVNLDRQLHATRRDARRRCSKVQVLAEGIRRGATARPFCVSPFEYSVVEEEGYRAALDCDVLFSCVDRPWPRSALNFIAYAHLIPVVDGGVRVEVTKKGQLKRADWRAHVAAPTNRCLECLGQYDAGLVGVERNGLLDTPSYIAGLPADHAIKRNENVFAFSLGAASLEVLQLLTMVVRPLGLGGAGQQNYHFVPGLLDSDHEACKTTCLYPGLTARGDSTGLVLTAAHSAAEEARARRAEALAREPWRPRLAGVVEGIADWLRGPR